MDKLCPTCGNYSAEYLLNCNWKDELRELLCKLENINYLANAEHMSELELYALLISLRREEQETAQ